MKSAKVIVGGAVSTASLVATVLAIVYAPTSFWEWWWRPGPMTALLGGISLLLLAWIALLYRAASRGGPSAYDQQRLDRVLDALPRPVITYWRDTDALGGWRAEMSEAVTHYAASLNEIEDRFRDTKMEEKRQALHRAADKFAEANAVQGVPARGLDGWRDVGVSASALDGIFGKQHDHYVNSGRILNAAADAVVDTYEALLETASERHYELRPRDV